jgi:hypothetical protein
VEAIDASGIDRLSDALKTILDGNAPKEVYELLKKLNLYDEEVDMVPYEQAKPSEKAIAIADFCDATKATSEQAKRLYEAIGSGHNGNGIRGMQPLATLQLFTKLAMNAPKGEGLADAPRIRAAAKAALGQGSYNLGQACRSLLRMIETGDFADEDQQNRVSTVLEICDEIDFHSKNVPYAKYDDCIDQHPRECVKALCEAAEAASLSLIDKPSANALFDLAPKTSANVALSTLAAALKLDPKRVGNIFEDANYIAKAMSEAKVLKGRGVMKYFVESIQDPGSPQRLWLHEKGVHSKKVTVPTWTAVLKALGDARIAEHQKEQAKRARTPASPVKPRKSARRPKPPKK